MQVEDESVVQEFLDVKWDLRAIDGSILGEAHFNGQVEARVIIRMGVELDGNGQERGSIEEKLGSRKMPEQTLRFW